MQLKIDVLISGYGRKWSPHLHDGAKEVHTMLSLLDYYTFCAKSWLRSFLFVAWHLKNFPLFKLQAYYIIHIFQEVNIQYRYHQGKPNRQCLEFQWEALFTLPSFKVENSQFFQKSLTLFITNIFQLIHHERVDHQLNLDHRHEKFIINLHVLFP